MKRQYVISLVLFLFIIAAIAGALAYNQSVSGGLKFNAIQAKHKPGNSRGENLLQSISDTSIERKMQMPKLDFLETILMLIATGFLVPLIFSGITPGTINISHSNLNKESMGRLIRSWCYGTVPVASFGLLHYFAPLCPSNVRPRPCKNSFSISNSNHLSGYLTICHGLVFALAARQYALQPAVNSRPEFLGHSG